MKLIVMHDIDLYEQTYYSSKFLNIIIEVKYTDGTLDICILHSSNNESMKYPRSLFSELLTANVMFDDL